MRKLFSFYKCHAVYCGTLYAVQEDITEEPICSACGCYYYSHIQDVDIELEGADIDAEVQVEQEGLTQNCNNDELCSA